MSYIVAEVGVNWDGKLELAKEMMKSAKKAGCNAVKFQAYEEAMVKDHPERFRLMNSAITKSNVEAINDLAKAIGIEWFCTPMYSDAVGILDPYVKRYKIRVIDGKPLLENKISNLLERVLGTGKEVIISSQTSPRGTAYYEHPHIKWLYCVPKYPCKLEDLDFRNLKDFDGFSNHCPKIIAPLSAAILGSKIIEVHVTSNKSGNFVDNNISLDFDEVTELVKQIRLFEIIHT
jgi:N,N'-diacetyllegionaminate synthase